MFQFLNDSQRKNLYNAFLVLVILLAVFVGLKAVNAFKEYSYIGRGTYAANVITVTGTGEVLALPDTGSFSFSVVEDGKTVKDAQDKATTKMNAIISALQAMGIDEKDIQTTGYNSYPKYDYGQIICPVGSYCPQGKQTLIGYEISQTIGVKVRKTADAGAALSKVGELGASNISGLDFVIDKPDIVQAEARDKAIADAKSKADALSKSLGIKLTKIVNFYESGSQPPIYYDKMNVMGAGASVPASVPQIPTGQNTITSQVTITYEVE